MRLRVDPPHPEHGSDIEVEVERPGATVGDLAAALGHTEAEVVRVAGRLVAPSTRIERAGLVDGSIVRFGPGERAPDPMVRLEVTTGFDIGRTWQLPVGIHELTRSDCSDLAAQRIKLRVRGDGMIEIEQRGLGPPIEVDGRAAVVTEPTATPVRRRRRRSPRPLPGWEAGSHPTARASHAAGPLIAGPGSILSCGRCTIEVSTPVRDPIGARPDDPTGGHRPIHRTPRLDHVAMPEPVTPPSVPERPSFVSPIGVASIVLSLAGAALIGFVLGSWTPVLFGLLGPVLMIGNSIDARIRRHRVHRGERRRRASTLAAFEADVARHQEVARRWWVQVHPGVADAIARCRRPEANVWERRHHHPDAFAVAVGAGEVPRPITIAASAGEIDPDLSRIIDERSSIGASIGLRLESGVALVGPHSATAAVARSMVVQAAVLHGPADLLVAALVGDAGPWDWLAWLPHRQQADGISLLADEPVGAHQVAEALREPGPRTLVLVDDDASLAAARSPARTILRASTSTDGSPGRTIVPLVLVDHPASVPACCSTILHVSADGTLRGPADLMTGPGAAAGIACDTAREVACRLAAFEDPERDGAAARLPPRISLGTTFGVEAGIAGDVAADWSRAGSDPPPIALLGRAADGPFGIDLASDGPHALVAGTTGAGKSELLRTFIASLALGQSPEHLTFVLVDFKGGSAFDQCARLPHVVGLVTDLDVHLAARAIRCLEAELRHRERLLRRHDAEDLAALRRSGGSLARLVVVIDEFAGVAADLPDFLDALVGIAQRGRSLGVHLVLATQRPAGIVSDHIRANTNLRIALRVQDPSDSSDVIDAPDAAFLPRRLPGRALVRLGPDELVTIQTACVTQPLDRGDATVTIRRLCIASSAADRQGPGLTIHRGPTELDAIVAATSQAWTRSRGRSLRRPWPDPVPTLVPWPVLEPDLHPEDETGSVPDDPPSTDSLTIGVADDPDHQRTVPFRWQLARGPLLVVGVARSGRSSVGAAVVLEAARRWTPEACHIHLVGGDDVFGPLAELPHVGSVISLDDPERQRRVIADLANDLAARRARGPAADLEATRPRRILVLDGLDAFHTRWDDLEPSGTWRKLLDLVSHGASVGIHLVVTGGSSLPSSVARACRQRLVLRLADRTEAAAFGVAPRAVPELTPGRAIAAETGELVQTAMASDGLASAVGLLRTTHPPAQPARAPSRIEVLPSDLTLDELPQPLASVDEAGGLSLCLGIADDGLAPAFLTLAPGGHALVAGPAGSGRTTLLRALAAAARSIGMTVHDASDPRAGTVMLERIWAGIAEATGPVVLIVDDAERVDHPALRRVAAERTPGVHVIASGRVDRLRAAYGHWTRDLMSHRTGVLLQPDPDLDGDLLATRLPRRFVVDMPPGRGWLVDPARPGGGTGVVQVARVVE